MGENKVNLGVDSAQWNSMRRMVICAVFFATSDHEGKLLSTPGGITPANQ